MFSVSYNLIYCYSQAFPTSVITKTDLKKMNNMEIQKRNSTFLSKQFSNFVFLFCEKIVTAKYYKEIVNTCQMVIEKRVSVCAGQTRGYLRDKLRVMSGRIVPLLPFRLFRNDVNSRRRQTFYVLLFSLSSARALCSGIRFVTNR